MDGRAEDGRAGSIDSGVGQSAVVQAESVRVEHAPRPPARGEAEACLSAGRQRRLRPRPPFVRCHLGDRYSSRSLGTGQEEKAWTLQGTRAGGRTRGDVLRPLQVGPPSLPPSAARRGPTESLSLY